MDRIEKQVFIRAPRARVWKALADAKVFGEWFGVKLNGQFAPGARMTGKITHPGYEHLNFEITVEKIEKEKLFSWRWHPHAIDPKKDYSGEPTTLIVFELKDKDGGTLVTVVESGFDGIPLSRQMEAYRGNEEGWEIQMVNIEKYVNEHAESLSEA